MQEADKRGMGRALRAPAMAADEEWGVDMDATPVALPLGSNKAFKRSKPRAASADRPASVSGGELRGPGTRPLGAPRSEFSALPHRLHVWGSSFSMNITGTIPSKTKENPLAANGMLFGGSAGRPTLGPNTPMTKARPKFVTWCTV